MKKQVVVRTAPTESGHWYSPKMMDYLAARLNDGYVVVMCNPIGNDLEYILEKEIED
jgi:hypothetical protein